MRSVFSMAGSFGLRLRSFALICALLPYQGSGEPKEPILKRFDNFQALQGNLKSNKFQTSSFLIMKITRCPTTREFLNSPTGVSAL